MKTLIENGTTSLVNLDIFLYFQELINNDIQPEELVIGLKDKEYGIVDSGIVPTILSIPEGDNNRPMLYLNNGLEEIQISKSFFFFSQGYDIEQQHTNIPDIENLVVKITKVFNMFESKGINIDKLGLIVTYFIETEEGVQLVSDKFLKIKKQNLIDIVISYGISMIIGGQKFNNKTSYDIGGIKSNGINKKGIIGSRNIISADKQKFTDNTFKTQVTELLKDISADSINS
ncbi:MAG: hypothetical protein AB7E37_01095 [Candidatus Altimarinota bacterium]